MKKMNRTDQDGCPARSQRAGTSISPEQQTDEIDRRILLELGRNGRTSMNDLAHRVHISRANAYARVHRMVQDGVIERFTALVSAQGVGLGASAYVALSIRQNSWREVREQLSRVQGIDHVALCSGEMDVIVLVRTADITSLRELVLEQLQSIPGVITTRTSIIFEEAHGGGVPGALSGTLADHDEASALLEAQVRAAPSAGDATA